MIILYKTETCPRCKVIEKKLQQLGLEYESTLDVQPAIDKGFRSAPILQDGDLWYGGSDFSEMVTYINRLGGMEE